MNKPPRMFLAFIYDPSNDDFEIRTDSNGNFEWLESGVDRKICFPRMIRHFEIVDNLEMSEDLKLSALSALWRDVSSNVGGYLFGDMSENNNLEQIAFR